LLNNTNHPHWWQSILKKLAATPFGIWLLAGKLHRLDRPILRLTNNRASISNLLTGLPIIQLTATGAKSGLPRTAPLVAAPDGDALILIATNFGNPRHPAWYYNLRAYPHAAVTVRGKKFPVLARLLEGTERERCWQKAAAHYPGYNLYKRRAAPRTIPVFLLEPDPNTFQKE
jgi:deazaflavin-dependent oxidoreductase (nitroreductase family)